MRLLVLNLKTSNNTETIVEGDTGLGIMSGLWRSKHPAVMGDDYDVELTLPDPTEMQVLLDPKDHEPGVAAIGKEYFRFRGQCEVVYEDGVIVVRLATNWGEIVGADNFVCKVGDWVEFTVPQDQVEIYPLGG